MKYRRSEPPEWSPCHWKMKGGLDPSAQATPIRQRSKWGSRRAAAPGDILLWNITLISTGRLETWNQTIYRCCDYIHVDPSIMSILKYGTIWGGHRPPSVLLFFNLLISTWFPCWDPPSPGHHQGLTLGHPGPLFDDVWWCTPELDWEPIELIPT